MTPDEGHGPAARARRQGLWSMLAVAAILVSLFFVGAFVRSHWGEVRRVPDGLEPTAFGVYLAVTAAYFIYQGLVWKLMYAAHGYRIGVRQVLTMYLSAILLAYVPGKVGASLGIAALARTARIPASVSVYLFLRAQLMFLFAGAVAAVTASLFVPAELLVPLPVRLALAAAAVAALVVALASRTLLRRGLGALLRLAKIEATVVPVSRAIWLRDLALLYASWFIYGFAFWWLVRGCAGDVAGVVPFSQVSLILIVSYLGAYLVVFVPAGLGVLETELIMGLGQILDPGAAVWIAVGHRVLTVLLCILMLVVLAAFGMISRGSRRSA